MSDHTSVAAVVVTHNRVAHLERCLHVLREQTRPLDEIVVFDNAGSDGTAEFLAGVSDEVSVLRSDRNIGSAGAFYSAIEEARSKGHDWFWLMDDDCRPREDALERLLEAVPEDGPVPMILGSRVLWSGDNRPHPMNQPIPKLDPVALAEAAGMGLLPIRANSFVSCLLHRDAVQHHGLPDREYFIWNDDLEYTARVLRRDVGYLVPASVVFHDTPERHTAHFATPAKFYFEVRNKLFMLRGRSWSPVERARWAKALVVDTAGFLRTQRYSRESLRAVGRGLRDGLRPRA